MPSYHIYDINLSAMNPDKKVIELMTSMGADISKSRPVYFYFYFPEEETALLFARRLRSMHFETKVNPPVKKDGDWLCLGSRDMVPDLEILDGLRRLLTPMAESLFGNYDGWETEMLL